MNDALPADPPYAALDAELNSLTGDQARIALRALWAASYINEDVVRRTIHLARSMAPEHSQR